MSQVIVPQQKKSNLLPIVGTVAGGILGAYYGGPAGAVAGASAGGAAGNMVGDLTSNGEGAPPLETSQQAPQSSAMARRMEFNNQDPYQGVYQANVAMESAPPEIREHYGPQLQEALKMARQQRDTSQMGGSYA